MAERIIDLDAARAARAEAEKEPVVVRFSGRDFTLAAELPWTFVEALGYAMTEGNRGAPKVAAGLRDLFGPEQWDAFTALGPTDDDILELSVGIGRTYSGRSAGESPASNGSSAGTSKRSKPTSSGSTGSTSA